MTQPNNPNPIEVSPDPGIQTSNFTVNGEYKFLLTGDMGIGLSKYQATSHNLYTTSGITGTLIDASGRIYGTYARDEALPSYHEGVIQTPSINTNIYGQYKLKELPKGGELLVQGGVNIRSNLKTEHELTPASPFGDEPVPFTVWESALTLPDGTRDYVKVNVAEDFTYNSGRLSTTGSQPVTTPKLTAKGYATLNYAKVNGNGFSFNVGAGVEGQGLKLNPLLTGVVAQELNNGAKITGGVNYSFTGGRKVDSKLLDEGFRSNRLKNIRCSTHLFGKVLITRSNPTQQMQRRSPIIEKCFPRLIPPMMPCQRMCRALSTRFH